MPAYGITNLHFIHLYFSKKQHLRHRKSDYLREREREKSSRLTKNTNIIYQKNANPLMIGPELLPSLSWCVTSTCTPVPVCFFRALQPGGRFQALKLKCYKLNLVWVLLPKYCSSLQWSQNFDRLIQTIKNNYYYSTWDL